MYVNFRDNFGDRSTNCRFPHRLHVSHRTISHRTKSLLTSWTFYTRPRCICKVSKGEGDDVNWEWWCTLRSSLWLRTPFFMYRRAKRHPELIPSSNTLAWEWCVCLVLVRATGLALQKLCVRLRKRYCVIWLCLWWLGLVWYLTPFLSPEFVSTVHCKDSSSICKCVHLV